MTKNRQPWVIPYRRSGRVADIQHQFPPTGFISPAMVGIRLVMSGMVHTAMQIKAFRVVDVFGMYIKRVTVRSVVTEMARTEKSAADTESCPMNPLATHAVPGCSWPVFRKMMPDTELFNVLINSSQAYQYVDFNKNKQPCIPATIKFKTRTWRKLLRCRR